MVHRYDTEQLTGSWLRSTKTEIGGDALSGSRVAVVFRTPSSERTNMYFSSDRRFKLWEYTVSHKQLLIRSPATPDISGNIDIIFWGVEYINVPSAFKGLSLNASTLADREKFKLESGVTLLSSVFCLNTENQRCFISDLGFKVLSNELDIFESTLAHPWSDHPVEWYGQVLSHS